MDFVLIQPAWCSSSVFIANFEQTLHIALCCHCWLWTNKCWLGLYSNSTLLKFIHFLRITSPLLVSVKQFSQSLLQTDFSDQRSRIAVFSTSTTKASIKLLVKSCMFTLSLHVLVKIWTSFYPVKCWLTSIS